MSTLTALTAALTGRPVHRDRFLYCIKRINLVAKFVIVMPNGYPVLEFRHYNLVPVYVRFMDNISVSHFHDPFDASGTRTRFFNQGFTRRVAKRTPSYFDHRVDGPSHFCTNNSYIAYCREDTTWEELRIHSKIRATALKCYDVAGRCIGLDTTCPSSYGVFASWIIKNNVWDNDYLTARSTSIYAYRRDGPSLIYIGDDESLSNDDSGHDSS